MELTAKYEYTHNIEKKISINDLTEATFGGETASFILTNANPTKQCFRKLTKAHEAKWSLEKSVPLQ